MTVNGHWVHNLDPVLIHLWGNFGIRYYGLAYVAGFIGGMVIHRRMARHQRSPLGGEQEETAVFAVILGVLLGARIGYVIFYGLDTFLNDPLFIFRLWEGGMSSHGGFIGVTLAGWWIARKNGMRLREFGDIVAPLVPLGLFLGRIANFINGELWGIPSSVPWAVIFPNSAPGIPADMIPPRHPSQLYEAALEGLVLFLYMQWRFWRTDAQKHPGRICGEFLILYGIFRIFCEQFREPDAALILGMSRGVFYSLILPVVGIFFWWQSTRLSPQWKSRQPEAESHPHDAKQKKIRPAKAKRE